MNKERSSNIELLRIIAMFMIIVSHIWCHCIDAQLSNDITYFSYPAFYKKLILFDIISPFGQIANGIFILISGYFLVEKENIDISKISIKLLSQKFFVTVFLVFISFFIFKSYGNYISINYFNEGSWFIGYYYFIILTSSLFINKKLKVISQHEYKYFLIIFFTLLQFGWLMNILSEISDGIRVCLVGLFMYVLGGYLKRYNPFEKYKTSSFVFAIVTSFVAIVYNNYCNNCININNYYLNNETYFHHSISGLPSNYLLVIILSVSMFELFNRLKIKKNKVINYMGASTLIIYIMHDNDFVYNLWMKNDWIYLLAKEPTLFVYDYLLWTFGIFEVGLLLYIIYNFFALFIPWFCKKMFLKKTKNDYKNINSIVEVLTWKK